MLLQLKSTDVQLLYGLSIEICGFYNRYGKDVLVLSKNQLEKLQDEFIQLIGVYGENLR